MEHKINIFFNFTFLKIHFSNKNFQQMHKKQHNQKIIRNYNNMKQVMIQSKEKHIKQQNLRKYQKINEIILQVQLTQLYQLLKICKLMMKNQLIILMNILYRILSLHIQLFKLKEKQMSEFQMKHKNSKFSQEMKKNESNIIDIENKTVQILGNVYDHDQINQDNIVFEGSQASSMAGLRKSVYYRKYTLINQLNNFTTFIPLLNKLFGFFAFALINQIIFISINMSFSKKDFYSLNYYYESIQINHYFIEPMQIFFLARYMLIDYQFLSLSQAISQDQLNYHLKFINPLITESYDEYKKNFQEHFKDEKLLEFIRNQYVLISQQSYHQLPVQLKEYNVTLFTAFSILLDSFYKLKQSYINPVPQQGANPHTTYQYKNYVIFVTIFDNISDQMYIESIFQIELVVKRWIIMVIPISFLLIFSLLLLAYYYNLFNHLLEKFFNLNQHIAQIDLDLDQKRQQFIFQSLKQGSELIHMYKFNLVGKEELLTKHKTKEMQKELKNAGQESRAIKFSVKISTIPLICCVLALLVQYLLICGSLTYVGSVYMSKFSKTIHFFKSISDIGVYVPASFSQKEILYFFSYFPYYTNDDRAFFVEQIQKAVTKIDTFLLQDIESSQLQFSAQFLDTYEYLEENNLCPLLNSSKYYDFDYFCSNSQNGILKLGLRASLTNFNSILKNELSINFPSTRKQPPKEELEAVYLCSDIITEITNKMEQDIKSQTQIIEELYNIITAISLTYTIVLIITIQFSVYKKFRLNLNRTKMISLIFPLETIFLNDHFERELRRMVTSEKLI
ncbi:unnamed protein product [Paramecium sonneborni]|uniref:Transmembrane protein n=1 Tax=Paramecium sonneborni TaxID=65129 RepID=A0A8S1R6H7_9CILI|nr:unnamed protein product [Paramecium sonneborni]